MLWLCLHPPRLSLEALGAPAEPPLAVTARRGSRRWIVACAAGIAPGTDLTAALVLHPQLRAVERDVRAERAALQSLAHLAYRFGQPAHLTLQESPDPF